MPTPETRNTSMRDHAIRYLIDGAFPEAFDDIPPQEAQAVKSGIRSMATAIAYGDTLKGADQAYCEAFDACFGRRTVRGPFN